MAKGAMNPSPKSVRAQLQACANSRCPVPDVEHPNSDVTKMSRVYVAGRRSGMGAITHRLHVDGMCQAQYRPSLLQR